MQYNESTAACKIQYLFRYSKCKQIINEIRQYNLLKMNDKNLEEFKRIILGKKINTLFAKLCKVYNNYKKYDNIKHRIIITAYMIYKYPQDIISNTHPYDYQIIDNANIMISMIENNNIDVNNIWHSINSFINQFIKWSTMDKNRLIEDCIKIYHDNSEHIDKIKSGDIVRKQELKDDEQINDMICELERQKQNIIDNIKSLDKDFDIKFFEENYKKIYTNITITKQKINDMIAINMKQAYYDMLCEDLRNGTLLSSSNMIKDIGYRLSVLCPHINKEKFNEKFTDNNITDILFDCAFTPKLIKFVFFMYDFITLIASTDVDYRVIISEMCNKEFYIYFPKILIIIQEKINDIYNMIMDIDKQE